MAQETSDLWKSLLKEPGTRKEYKFEVNGVTYTEAQEISHSVEAALFEELSIGNASSAKLQYSVVAEDIPKAATIKRFVRLVNGEEESEWRPAGVYFANTRSEEDGVWNIEAFDVMRKAEMSWHPDQSLVFPMSVTKAVDEFCKLLGCSLDPRTKLDASIELDYPASDPESQSGDYYSIRQELQWIAAAHAGNWIVTAEGKLLLLPLGGEPEDTNYLVDESGDAITFGGVRILV